MSYFQVVHVNCSLGCGRLATTVVERVSNHEPMGRCCEYCALDLVALCEEQYPGDSPVPLFPPGPRSRRIFESAVVRPRGWRRWLGGG